VGLLDGKRLLVTGVLTDRSIAFSTARLAAEQGATVVLSSFGRPMSLTQRVAKRLPSGPPVVQLDVSSEEDLAALADRLREHVDGLDGVVHAVGFAPAAALGSGLLDTSWDDVGTALQVSTWSYAALARACSPLLVEGSSYVGLTFDARVAWPSYDWMGVAKAGLESANRYLARDLGPRGRAGQPRGRRVPSGPWRRRACPGFAASRTCGTAGPARLGRGRRGAGGAGVRGAAVGLVPRRRRGRSSTSTAASGHGRVAGRGRQRRRAARA
jgi:enoyl-[acyl-carrier protein] reductase I